MLKRLWQRLVDLFTPDAQETWKDKPIEYPPELPTPGHPWDRRLTIGVVVGHTKKSPGAMVEAPLKTYEYFENKRVAQKMKDYASKKLSQNVVVNVYYRDGIGIAGAYTKAMLDGCDCVIELHFNAFNKAAYGTETLCTMTQMDKDFAKVVQSSLVKLFQRDKTGDRGVKPRAKNDRGWASVSALPTMANCLVEPFFSDNPKEMALYMKVRDEYPGALVDAAIEWAASVNC